MKLSCCDQRRKYSTFQFDFHVVWLFFWRGRFSATVFCRFDKGAPCAHRIRSSAFLRFTRSMAELKGREPHFMSCKRSSIGGIVVGRRYFAFEATAAPTTDSLLCLLTISPFLPPRQWSPNWVPGHEQHPCLNMGGNSIDFLLARVLAQALA